MNAVRRWGLWTARHRRTVLVAWVVVLVLTAFGYQLLSSRLGAPDYGVPGSESDQLTSLIARDFPSLGTEQDVIVFRAEHGHVTDSANRASVARTLKATHDVPGVIRVISPFSAAAHGQVSKDGTAAFGVIELTGSPRQVAKSASVLQQRVLDTSGAVHAWVTGYSPLMNDLTATENADSSRSEAIGMPAALIILVIASGSLIAASLPIIIALAALLLAFGALGLVSLGMHTDAFLVAITSMIGLGIGVDYSLFVVSRFREELRRTSAEGPVSERAVHEAVATSLQTSGRTILFSGSLVALSICSLFLINSPIFHEISIGVLVVVLSTLIAAWTLLPAVLAMLGTRVNRLALRRPRQAPSALIDDTDGWWGRWATAVTRHPVVASTSVIIALLVFAAPLHSLRYGIDMGTSSLHSRPSGIGTSVLEQEFGPGLVAPVYLLATGTDNAPLSPSQLSHTASLVGALAHDKQVSAVVPMTSHERLLAELILSIPADSTQATSFVSRLRTNFASALGRRGVSVLVGGTTAEFTDVAHATTSRIGYILLIVLAFSFLALIGVFRSILLPLEAVLMNLLATAASVGVTVAVFQWGYLSSFLGFTSVGYLQVYIPITIFVVLFGLSMDYEIFLIRRIEESWKQTGDNTLAIVKGVAHTARPISAAAAIMVMVFGSFVSANVLELKQFGLGLAVAVLLDASLIRLILVPAVMRLAGRWNWWLPGRRD